MLQQSIHSILTGNTALYDAVNGQIYPLIAPINVTNSYIVHTGNIIPVYTKSGLEYDEYDYYIFLASTDYSSLNEILTQIREIIEFQIKIYTMKCNIINIAEYYSDVDEAFIKKIQMNIFYKK